MSPASPLSPTPDATVRGAATALVARGRTSAVLTGALVALMWVLELLDTITGHALDQLGLSAWHPGDLWGIFTAPLVHLGWAHLEANSVLLLVLGFLVGLEGVRRWLAATFVVVVCSGLAAWTLSLPGTLTLGASGVVFGWLSYLVVRAWYSRDAGQAVLSLVLLALYGGVLWGVLPTQQGVSWQAHLGGAVGGVLAAWLLHSRSRRVARD